MDEPRLVAGVSVILNSSVKSSCELWIEEVFSVLALFSLYCVDLRCLVCLCLHTGDALSDAQGVPLEALLPGSCGG